MKRLICGAHCVDPANGLEAVHDVLIENGRITEIGENLSAKGGEMIEAAGLYLFPGFVDLHCHLREPGFEYKETIASGTRAAAAGGFTSICCMANTKPVIDTGAMVASVLEKARETGVVRVYPIGALSKGLAGKEISEMGDMKYAGAVAVSDDGHPVMNAQLMRLAMQYAAQFDLPVVDHCEDLDLLNEGAMNEGFTSTLLGLRGITRAAEETHIARDIILAETLSLPVHIAHVSTKGSVRLLRDAKARGVHITAETAPHYIAGTEEMALGYDPNTRVNPPLRTEADRLAIIDGLSDGTLDCIATDHAPHHRDDKMVEYNVAANGISGFESAFALCYTELVRTGRMTLAQLIDKMTCTPARLFGLPAGTLSVGENADCTLVRLDDPFVLEPDKFLSKGKNNPFSGRAVYGRIIRTLVGGEDAYIGRDAE